MNFGVISHSIVTQLKALPPSQAAEELRVILHDLDDSEDRVFASRGMACMMIEERELWQYFDDPDVGQPFASMDRFLKWAAPKSWSYCRDAMRVVKELGADFPDLLRIRRCNLEQLKRVSSNVRQLPAVIEAAKTLPEKAFVETLNKTYAQHLEVKQPVVMASAEDCQEFEAAIARAMERGATTRAEAIKDIAVNYLLDFPISEEQSA